MAMTVSFKFPSGPSSRLSPSTHPPNHKALLLGINYASPPDDSEPVPSLEGPVNDVNEMKQTMISEARLLPHPFPPPQP